MKKEREAQNGEAGSFSADAQKHAFLGVSYQILPRSMLSIMISGETEQLYQMLPGTHPFPGEEYFSWVDEQGILNSVVEGAVKKVPFPQGTTFEAFPEFIVAKNQIGSGEKRSLIRFKPGAYAAPLPLEEYDALDKSRML